MPLDDMMIGPLAGEPSQQAGVIASVLGRIRAGEGTAQKPWLLYGGQEFEPGADFPQWMGARGPTGELTHAAGPYQWEPTTWAKWGASLGDFNDLAVQNQAAWNLASHTYGVATGRSLLDDATAGQVEWGALASQWPSLAGGRAASISEAAPAGGGLVMGSPHSLAEWAAAQQPQGQPQAAPLAPAMVVPDYPTPESRLTTMLMMASLAGTHKFVPIHYDPFAGMGGAARPLAGVTLDAAAPAIHVPELGGRRNA